MKNKSFAEKREVAIKEDERTFYEELLKQPEEESVCFS